MKKVKTFMAIMSIATTSLFFVSCDKNDEKPQAVLERDYFTVQNATLHQGEIPQLSSASPFSSVNINHNVLPGGSSFVSLNSEEQISEVYLSVEGVNEYYRLVQNVEETQTNIAQFVILFSQKLTRSFTIRISALLSSGSLTSLYTAQLQFIRAGTGALQISLSFDNDKDVDLYVVEPNGRIIFYLNRGEEVFDEETGKYYRTWGLDIDSNAACNIDGINNENIYYPEEYIQSGKYEVWVNMYSNCNASIPTNWVITATKQGSLVPVSHGQNPASGVFPAGTQSNPIGSSLNGALKVMEFTMNGTYSPSAQAMSLHSRDESAVKKLKEAGEF